MKGLLALSLVTIAALSTTACVGPYYGKQQATFRAAPNSNCREAGGLENRKRPACGAPAPAMGFPAPNPSIMQGQTSLGLGTIWENQITR